MLSGTVQHLLTILYIITYHLVIFSLIKRSEAPFPQPIIIKVYSCSRVPGLTVHLSLSYEFMGSTDTLEGAIIIVIFQAKQLHSL